MWCVMGDHHQGAVPGLAHLGFQERARLHVASERVLRPEAVLA